MFSKLFSRNVKINKYNSNKRNERNKNVKHKIRNNHLNKSLFKFI